MSKKNKGNRPLARIPRGFRDIAPEDLSYRWQMLEKVRRVYEAYGFQPLDTPALEYVDALGKHLPESDEPQGGIFAFRFEDEQWVAMRYDLTAPLARYVAQHRQELAYPFRRYQFGPVYRFEKPDPGRFREFYQFDFDTVGTANPLADAEVCMILADAMEALAIERGHYIVRVNNRKLLNGLLETLGLHDDDQGVASADERQGTTPRSTVILRALDKLDKVGPEGVRHLLGKGRKDESGVFVPGANLEPNQIDTVMRFLATPSDSRSGLCDTMEEIVGGTTIGKEGVEELRRIDASLTAAGFGEDRVAFDLTVVRGLGYYTGPVYEVGLTFEVEDEDGRKKQFGSVAGGGRYDGLVERFTGEKVPATGASIGVDRLLDALKRLDKLPGRAGCPVLVTVMDKSRTADYLQIAREIRDAGIPCEVYTGTKNFGKQMKYADARGAMVAIIAGSDEFERGEVAIKDLYAGLQAAKAFEHDRDKWVEERPAQQTVKRTDLVAKVTEIVEHWSTKS